MRARDQEKGAKNIVRILPNLPLTSHPAGHSRAAVREVSGILKNPCSTAL